MKESLLDTFEAETHNLSADQSLRAILADSETLLAQMKHIRDEMTRNKDLNLLTAQKDLKVKTDYFNSQTLKHEKTLNKKIKTFSNKIDTVVAKGITIDSIYPFKLADLDDKDQEFKIMTLSIFIDLLYQGQFDLIDKLEPLMNFSNFIVSSSLEIPPNLKSIYSIFKPMLSITNDMKLGDFIPLLNWIHENSLKIEGIDPLYELNLLTEYSIMIMNSNNDHQLPMGFTNSSPLLTNLSDKWYYNQYQSSLEDISSYIATPIDELISKFRQMYTSVSNEITSLGKLPSASPIDEILTVAHISMDVFAKYCESQKSSKSKAVAGATSDNHHDDTKHLPFEVELPQWLHHHSIFICPVSREETSIDDPPIYMPCGHMVSTDTMKRLSKNCTRNFKCPYCPQTMTSRQCLDVNIIDL